MRTRLRAFAGLWALVGLLGSGIVFAASAAGPVTTGIEDDGVRQMVADAPYTGRDLISTRRAEDISEADSMAQTLASGLPDTLTDVVENEWAYLFTQVAPGGGVGAGMVGQTVATSDYGLAPVVSLHHQPDLDGEISIIDGQAAASDDEVVEVMVSQQVAESLELTAGAQYRIYPGSMGVMRHPRTGDWVTAGTLSPLDDLPEVTVRVSGVFIADEAGAPVWDHLSQLVNPGFVTLPIGDPPFPPAPRAGLLTDRTGMAQLLGQEMAGGMSPQAGVRMRLHTSLLDAAWATAATEALARAQVDPALTATPIQTGLPGVLAEFQELAAAMRAVITVAAAGIVATLIGLLALAARLIMDRRRDEVALLRARGGSLAVVVGRIAIEALPVALLAGAAGWLLHRWAVGLPVASMPAATSFPVVVAAASVIVVWLLVPVTAALVGRSGAATARRADLGRSRARPARLTLELAVVLLAGLGVLLVQQRGLAADGVDPYLSAVPVLLALAAGLVALRLYPWPLRALAALARRLRGVVGFVGLARAGRAAPGAALALLVLALAVSAGGFATAVHAGVDDARQDGATQAVGAHLRVTVEDLPAGAQDAVAAVPGVEAVALTARGGVAMESPVRHGRALTPRDVQGSRVVVADIAEYQNVLDVLGVDVQLPVALSNAAVAAKVDDEVPVLAAPGIGNRNEPTVRIADTQRPMAVIDGVAHLPGPERNTTWALVPEQAWPEGLDATDEHAGITEFVLLVGGEHADPEAVRAAVADLPEAGTVSVVSMQGFRAELEDSGFNSGLTLVLVAGLIGAVAGGVLAVSLAMVVQARARGRVLSLMRTMGLSTRQARGLLLVELLPLTVLAVGVGAVVGAVLPLLLGDALGLGEFTGGVAPTFQVEPGAVAVLGALMLGLVLAGAAIEAVVNRRLGLGAVLRVE